MKTLERELTERIEQHKKSTVFNYFMLEFIQQERHNTSLDLPVHIKVKRFQEMAIEEIEDMYKYNKERFDNIYNICYDKFVNSNIEAFGR